MKIGCDRFNCKMSKPNNILFSRMGHHGFARVVTVNKTFR
jgi:hypothetical protein